MSKSFLSFLLVSGAMHVWAGLTLPGLPEAPPEIHSIAVKLDGLGQAGPAVEPSQPAEAHARAGEKDPAERERASKTKPDDRHESVAHANPQATPQSEPEAGRSGDAETEPRPHPVAGAAPRSAERSGEQAPATSGKSGDTGRIATAQQTQTAETATDAPPAVAAQQNDSRSRTAEQARPRIEAELTRRLADHFTYPRLAQRRGWEGKVRLGMQISASGRISDIHVVEGSGYRVLDTAAVRSAGRIGRYPEAAELLQGRHLDVVIPVHYRLL